MCYIFEELHRGRSVVGPEFAVPSRPALMRWRKNEPLNWGNLVVFEREEANKHEKECLIGAMQPEEVWSEETVTLVEKRRIIEKQSRDHRLL